MGALDYRGAQGSPMPQDPNKASKVDAAGLTSSANGVRNTASRILDLVGALESVI